MKLLTLNNDEINETILSCSYKLKGSKKGDILYYIDTNNKIFKSTQNTEVINIFSDKITSKYEKEVLKSYKANFNNIKNNYFDIYTILKNNKDNNLLETKAYEETISDEEMINILTEFFKEESTELLFIFKNLMLNKRLYENKDNNVKSTSIYDKDNKKSFIFVDNKNNIETLERIVFEVTSIKDARKNTKNYIKYNYRNNFKNYNSYIMQNKFNEYLKGSRLENDSKEHQKRKFNEIIKKSLNVLETIKEIDFENLVKENKLSSLDELNDVLAFTLANVCKDSEKAKMAYYYFKAGNYLYDSDLSHLVGITPYGFSNELKESFAKKLV